MTTTVTPVEKTIVLDCTPERAFAVFTERIGDWWPIEILSVFGEGTTCTFDERRIFETSPDGETNEWGTVVVWDPPHRLVFSWSPGREASVATEVEVTFTADEDGTRFVLVHRGWERLGEEAERMRGVYDNGWDGVLERYLAAA